MAAEKPSCRLLYDAPGSGAWNMAVDEVLLDSAAQSGQMTMRFYRWSEPTLSLGYFQRYADRSLHAKSAACPVVRRSTGGGAIVHDVELTYSIAVPSHHPLARQADLLYDAAHESLLEALASWGVRGRRVSKSDQPYCHTKDEAANRTEPFLCFQRRACGDVLVDQWKICGSAQRRHRQAILQHGSVLMGMSAAATELPGLREITGITLHENELFAAWRGRLSSRLNVRAIEDELTPDEIAAARALTVSKHTAETWIARR